eukprot:500587-Rhodomonas_salina.1
MEADEAEQQHTSCAAPGSAMCCKRPRREVASTRMGIESERVQAKRRASFAANEYIATGEGKTGG